MKAILCKEFGPPSSLVIEDVPDLVAKKGEVLIAIKACGVNFPDTLIIQGKYQFKPPFPFSPGSDLAGIVKSVGEGVTRFKVGDAVLAMTIYGAYAQEIALPESSCFPMPNGMDFPTAASFMLAYGTSYHALKDRAQLKAGETLVVLGASGGVGLTAVELAKLMGAKVIAAASTEEKLNLCKEKGADFVINYTKEDLKLRIKELTEGQGADVVYDPIGGKYTESALRAIKWKGRYLVVGFATGEIPKIPLNLPLLKGCQIVGVFFGQFMVKYSPQSAIQNTIELMQFFQEGKIKPHIYKVYSMENAYLALEDTMNRKVRGKAIISME